MSRVNKIGIIVEDTTDYDAARVLIKRITGKDNLSFKHKSGNGCGKIKNKCYAWSYELSLKGCNLLILIHDSDGNDAEQLERDLANKLKGSPIANRFISVPIQELEAWFLSDPSGIQAAFKFKTEPKINGLPEAINNPKEALEDVIYKGSNREILYTTSHNELIANNVSIELMKSKCPTFKTFHDFVTAQKYRPQ